MRIARWFLPWLCVLGVSSSLAYAANIGLVRTLSNLPTQPANADPAHAHWITLSVLTESGGRREFLCMTGITSSDLVINRVELDRMAAQMCSRLDMVVAPSEN